MSLDQTLRSILSPYDQTINIKYLRPVSDLHTEINRFTGKKVKKIRKSVGLRIKTTIKGRSYKMKTVLIEMKKQKGEKINTSYSLSLEIRELGELVDHTQREKLQIANELRKIIDTRLDIQVKQLKPAVVKYKWSLEEINFSMIEKKLEKAVITHLHYDFSILPEATKPIGE
ncbi:MAG: hypothetical protein INQ03_02340 [Candidatus Heimdallarchaeota archaeon]|nr:hypothetical protein [Candidatus Heimdallarchaeota archaeon]